MKNLTNVLGLLLTTHRINGVSFLGIRNYQNTQGEISNQTLNVGVSYEKAMQNDFFSLQINKEKIMLDLAKTFELALIEKAYNELYVSLEKRLSSPEIKELLRLENDSTIKRSDAQKDAFTHITTGVKVHDETGKIHVYGFVERKTVLVPIEYPKTQTRELTICKRTIEKLCKCKLSKYKTFYFDKAEVRVNGFSF
jgi:hypothetical protein